MTYVESGRVQARSRAGKPIHSWLPELAALGDALAPRRAILDGEVTALVGGRPSIEALQQRMRTRRPAAGSAPAVLWIFDLLYIDDELLIRRSYRHRRQLLEDLDLRGSTFQTVPVLFGEGDAMLQVAQELEFEGIIAKRLDAAYTPGRRSRSWLKVLDRRRLHVLVGGWVPSPAGVAALLVGEPDPATGRLCPVGRVDHGFTPRTRAQLAALLAPLETAHSPFTGAVGGSGGWGRSPGPPPRWVQPVVEVVIEQIGREPSGRLRHPAYAGLA